MNSVFLQKCISEAGLEITEYQIEALITFAEELKKWNKKINLTAITNDDEIAIKHLVDALFFADFIGTCETVLDIGSGAGIPSIPLKIVKPEMPVVSVDAVAKKIHFQRHIARLLKFDHFEALHVRVEELQKTSANSFEVITSRAFSSLETFVRLGAPLLHESGRMIAMKGPIADKETQLKDEELLADLGFKIIDVHSYSLPFNSGKRSLILIKPCKAP